jgi:hypothetical protein
MGKENLSADAVRAKELSAGRQDGEHLNMKPNYLSHMFKDSQQLLFNFASSARMLARSRARWGRLGLNMYSRGL